MHNYRVMAAFPRNHLLVVVIMICLCNVRQATSCLEGERQALLMFKGGLVDEFNRLGSWVDVGGDNCCNWSGVSCNSSTGHVIGLHLQDAYDPNEDYEAYDRTQLSGRISPWLLHLKQLVHLNLSGNYFGQIQIPPFLGQMTSLKQLDLSYAGFGGKIPSQIGNLTNLDTLDLSFNDFQPGPIPEGFRNLSSLRSLKLGFNSLSSDSLQWVSSLYLLHHLDLSDADLSKSRDWLHSINSISSLSELILSRCDLDLPYSVPLLNNLSSLVVLDLYGNFLEKSSSIPKWIFQLHNLNTLDLSDCNYQPGLIPEGPQNLSRLRSLDLSGNNFNSTIPKWIFQLHNLNTLDLSDCNYQPGLIPEGPQNLSRLRSLDLSGNNFNSTIPKWIFQLHNLNTLDLSDCNYQPGLIPEGPQNLSRLRSLDLSGNNFNSTIPKWIFQLHNLNTLDLSDCNYQPGLIPEGPQNLSRLRSLDLSGNNFNSTTPKWIFHLHNLNTLDLSSCYFQPGPIPEGLRNLSRLRSLDLSDNKFNSTIPSWLYGFSSGLEILHLEENSLQGVISSAIGNLTSLSYLELRSNSDLEIGGRETTKSMGQLCQLKHLGLSGVKVNPDVADIFRDLFSSCPSNGLEELDLSSSGISGNLTEVSFQRFESLVRLDLWNNSISGSIPLSFGELQSLEEADLEGNSMVGSVSEAQFAKLARLETFYAGGNKVELKASPSWIPPFQLVELDLSSWQLGKELPPWLHSQKNIGVLEMSGCGFEGPIPEWFENMSVHLRYLGLSNNQLKGEVPTIFSNIVSLDLSNNSFESLSKGFWNFPGSLFYLNLSYNHIVGEIPSGHALGFTEYAVLDLRSNKFQGRIPPFSSKLESLDLSDNSFTGSLSHFLCYQMKETKGMQVLFLSNNFLSGEIPDCWVPWNGLKEVRLSNNNFTGCIPSSMKNLRSLHSLHLQKNNLEEGLHLLLRSSEKLVVLDLSENQLQGDIPSRIGGNSHLTILNLRSNRFHGKLSREICALNALQVIDLANNNLSGPIPRCINKLSAMITKNSMGIQFSAPAPSPRQARYYVEDAMLVMKGMFMEYTTNLNLVRTMDFSNNSFTGKIPDEVTALAALQTLNLSQNMLTGEIPQTIGAMKSLESLDLSLNRLNGEIPSSMSSLTFLSHLNLSSNNLTGMIPSSTQLQTLDPSCFGGNDLCGPPLAKSCYEYEATPPATDTHDGTHATYFDDEWFFVSVAFGFVIGFWGFLFHLFCNRQWRIAFFSFLDRSWIFLRELVSR